MKILLLASVLSFPPVDITPDRSLICLSEAVFFEARGEGQEGMEAVAEVVMARVRSRKFPNTVCGVVYQPSRNPLRRRACAFSFTCNNIVRKIKQEEIYSWDQSVQIADKFITGPTPTNHTLGALHYVKCDIRYKVIWAKKLKLKRRIHNHCFLE